MQAIFELIGALIGAIVEAIIALVELMVHLIVFVIIALTRGAGEAKKQSAEKRQARIASRQSASSTDAKRSTISRSWMLVIGTVILVAVAGGLLFETIQGQRKEQTERQIAQKAETLIDEIKKAPDKLPEPGLLPDRDAWGRPLELFVDKFPAGAMIVVRSHGRDGRPGTLDDLLAIKTSNPAAIDIGKEIAKRAADKVKKFLK